jgi:type III secretory pathway component EscT
MTREIPKSPIISIEIIALARAIENYASKMSLTFKMTIAALCVMRHYAAPTVVVVVVIIFR